MVTTENGQAQAKALGKDGLYQTRTPAEPPLKKRSVM